MNQHKCKTCTDCKQNKLNEEAAAGSTGGEAVAGVVGRLFKGVKDITKRKTPSGPTAIPVIKYSNKKLSETARNSFSAFLSENEDKFDSADIISKLSQNSKIADDLDGDELAVFGMESDDGAITKVYIPKEQAKEFERALADRLREAKDTTGEEEIAAILFELKDRFKIVDVKWPTVQEDEEQQPNPDELGTDPMADPNADPMADPMADPAAGAEGSNVNGDMISQILDMLRQDAEARKADAEAKIADAHAREADAAQRTAAVKLRGEEEVMDAEAHFKQKKEEKKEAERLKMIARFRQENKMSQDTADSAPMDASSAPKGKDEDEEAITVTRKTLLNILRGGQ